MIATAVGVPADVGAGSPVTVESTVTNPSQDPCQFPRGYCPKVTVTGPPGVTDEWYASGLHRHAAACSGDEDGYVLKPGATLTVVDVWDGKTCDDALLRGIHCNYAVDGNPPGGQYVAAATWDAATCSTFPCSAYDPAGAGQFTVEGPGPPTPGPVAPTPSPQVSPVSSPVPTPASG